MLPDSDLLHSGEERSWTVVQVNLCTKDLVGTYFKTE